MSTRRIPPSFKALIGVAVVLIGLAVLAIGLTVSALRSDALEDAVQDSGNIATVLAEQTARSVQSIDLVLTGIQEHLTYLGVETPDDFHRLMRTESGNRFLRDRLARLPQADVIALIDKDGQILNSTRSWPSPTADVTDRDYFQHLKATDDNKLHVSIAVANRVSGTQTIFFGKRLNDVNGDFLGVVLIGIRIAYFRHIYDSITTLRGQWFLFLRTDGSVLVRYPDKEERAGLRMPANSPWYRAVANGGGFYRSPGYFDAEARLVAVRPLRDYPLVVNVAVSETTALANWRRRATLIGLGTLLAVFCSAFLLRTLFNQVRRLSHSEATLAERRARLAEKSRELERANLRLDAALNNMSQGLCMFDKDERLVVCNERYLSMYCLSADAIKPGCQLRDMLQQRAASGIFSGDPEQYVAALHATLARGESSYITTELSDGRIIAVLNQPIAEGGWVATHEDITERQRAEARIAHMARHDALTDLANRTLFREKMDEALARLRLSGDEFAIFIFDLDLFKAVNDSLGHPIGDALLKQVAHRLRDCTGGRFTVGRLGGDEFAIIQTDEPGQRQAAIALAGELIDKISAPYDIEGNQIVIGISIGIALAPRDGTDAGQLLKNADLALYRAKSEGRKGYRFFELEMDEKARLQRALEIDLRNALARDEFELHYQKLVDIATHRTCGVEALVRWRHPQHGLVAPDNFIPAAEETGVIIPLGEWILRTACRDAAKWPAQVKLAVNLSPLQFRSGNLVDVVSDALARSGLPPQRLELEITELVLLHNEAGNLATLHELAALGVCIVLDDFGTGYSSLSYLRTFPFEKIKIDRSFVAELTRRADCGAIVCAITSLGKSLNVATAAEGVETREQFELLRAAGCSQAQGFLFSRPQPAGDLDFADDEHRHKVA